MKKASMKWLFVFAPVVLVVHSADAVGQMGGIAGGGGKIKGGIGSRVKSKGNEFSTAYSLMSGGKTSCYAESCSGGSFYEGRNPNCPIRRPEPVKPYPGNREAVGIILNGLFWTYIAYLIWVCCFLRNTTMMMVQVAIKNSSMEIQCDFSQTAKRMTPSGGKGLDRLNLLDMMSDTLSRILYHADCCVSAASFVDVVGTLRWKRRFEQMCGEQMRKSDGRFVEHSIGRQVDDYVVVTVLVAAGGSHKLPAINCLADLRKAFSCLESRSLYIEAVKVFWTPPNGRTTMLEDELVEEFPHLRPWKVQHKDTIISRFLPRVSAFFTNHQSPKLEEQEHRVEQIQLLNPPVERTSTVRLYRTKTWG